MKLLWFLPLVVAIIVPWIILSKEKAPISKKGSFLLIASLSNIGLSMLIGPISGALLLPIFKNLYFSQVILVNTAISIPIYWIVGKKIIKSFSNERPTQDR